MITPGAPKCLSICQRLHKAIWSLPAFRFPLSRASVPADGVYFMFEAGETGHGGDRIVRVGSHTGRGNLASRLSEHMKVNKDRSVFRKHIGRALLFKERDPFLDSWNRDLTPRDERDTHRVDPARKIAVEEAVSEYIQTNISVRVIEALDCVQALRMERLCIATVAQCRVCGASGEWLGRCSPIPKIANGRLWQVQHLLGPVLSEEDLRTLT